VRESVEKVWDEVARATPAAAREPFTESDMSDSYLRVSDERGMRVPISLRLETVVAVEAVPISRPPNVTKADFLAAARRRRAQQ
jgi:hypothetical protein